MHADGNGRTAAVHVGAALVLCTAVARGAQPEQVGPATREALALCEERRTRSRSRNAWRCSREV